MMKYFIIILIIHVSIYGSVHGLVHKFPKFAPNIMNRSLTRTEIKLLEPRIDFEPPPPTRISEVNENGNRNRLRQKVNPKPQLFNGSDVSIYDCPWQVAIIQDSSYFCGGSLISRTWVLTAAHCLKGMKYFDIYMATTQLRNPSRLLIKATIAAAKIHEKFNPEFLNNDIGVIKLTPPIPTATSTSGLVGFIQLPSPVQARETFIGQSLNVTGWGSTGGTFGVNTNLSMVTLTVISNTECALHFGLDIVKSSSLCTYGVNNVCNGDSGDPLVYQEPNGKSTQLGIVSFGSATGCKNNYPVGFTRVSSFIGWIFEKTGVKRI